MLGVSDDNAKDSVGCSDMAVGVRALLLLYCTTRLLFFAVVLSLFVVSQER